MFISLLVLVSGGGQSDCAPSCPPAHPLVQEGSQRRTQLWGLVGCRKLNFMRTPPQALLVSYWQELNPGPQSGRQAATCQLKFRVLGLLLRRKGRIDIGGNSLCLSCKLLSALKDKFLCLLGKCWQHIGEISVGKGGVDSYCN